MSRQGLFVDQALARRIESADAWVGVESARIHAQLHPESGATWIPVAGGFAIFAGIGSVHTQVLGLGIERSVTEEEFDEVEEFFKVRGAGVSMEICPLVDRAILPLLAARGYVIAGFSNMLVRRLPASSPAIPAGECTVRHCSPTEGELWAKTVLEGFSGPEAVTSENVEVLLSLFHQPGTVCLLGMVEGKPAGGGALSVHENVAAMYGASTIPEFRRRGVQSAVIQSLVAEAIDARCDLVYTLTEPGSVSNRTLERQDFRLAYTRVNVRRQFS